MPRRVLLVFPTVWDRVQLAACRGAWRDRFEVRYAAPDDDDVDWDFDAVGYVERLALEERGRLEGVLSSSDYPGATVAAAVATELGLAGSRPEAVITASHKYYSRLAQAQVAPEAVPRFALLDPADPGTWTSPVGFPCFVKPVRGAFSVLARRIADRAELEEFLGSPEVAAHSETFVHIFGQLLRRYTDLAHSGGYFLAESLLEGDQVTVEGWVTRAGVEILGIVDSLFYPGTRSFSGFVYPSSLSEALQRRMEELTRRVISRLGLVDTFFNVELIHDPRTDVLSIVEVNPRLCGQFGDLYQKVDGVSSYELALSLAGGDEPRVKRRRGGFGVAGSFPLRVFERSRVLSAPGAERVRAVESRHPGTRVWLECGTGDELVDFSELEDGHSRRFAVVNLGADGREALHAKLALVRGELGFELEVM